MGILDVDVFLVINRGCMHKAGHLAFFFVQLFVIIIHRSLRSLLQGRTGSIQKFAKSANTFATKDTEQLPLLICELTRCFAAEGCKFRAKKCLNSSKTEMGELWTMIEQSVNPLVEVSSQRFCQFLGQTFKIYI